MMRLFEEMEGLVSSKLRVIKACVSMITLEARLAGLGVYPLLVNLCMLLICLMSVWLVGMSILGYALAQVLGNALHAMIAVFLINTLVFGILCVWLSSTLKRMSFSKTRAFLSRDREAERHELNKTDDDYAGKSGNNAMATTSASE